MNEEDLILNSLKAIVDGGQAPCTLLREGYMRNYIWAYYRAYSDGY